jgi:ribA/ribD-fused uncharacterized protein
MRMTGPGPRPEIIGEFAGARRFLSNFWPAPLTMDDGITYPTAEHAYQAHKAADRLSRAAVARLATPGEAKEAGQRLALRPDWASVRKPVMLRAVLGKFGGHPDLARQLCGTGSARLVEGNTWHDNYWGDCGCGRPECAAPGANYLGEILMAARLILRPD